MACAGAINIIRKLADSRWTTELVEADDIKDSLLDQASADPPDFRRRWRDLDEQAFDLVWRSPQLSPGDPFVRIIPQSGESINFDYIEILD